MEQKRTEKGKETEKSRNREKRKLGKEKRKERNEEMEKRENEGGKKRNIMKWRKNPRGVAWRITRKAATGQCSVFSPGHMTHMRQLFILMTHNPSNSPYILESTSFQRISREQRTV